MGLLRCCSIESNSFEMVVEDRYCVVRIHGSCRGCIRYLFLGKADSRWLLATVEERLQEMGTSVFRRRSRASSPAVLTQRCSNTYGRFLGVEEHEGSRRRGHILVPEGRNGEGWRIFAAELRWVVNLFQSSFADQSLLSTRKPCRRRHLQRRGGGEGHL